MIGVGGVEYRGAHAQATLATLERLPLGQGDLVYLSPFIERPGSGTPGCASAGLDADERGESRPRLSRWARRLRAAGVKAARYDISRIFAGACPPVLRAGGEGPCWASLAVVPGQERSHLLRRRGLESPSGQPPGLFQSRRGNFFLKPGQRRGGRAELCRPAPRGGGAPGRRRPARRTSSPQCPPGRATRMVTLMRRSTAGCSSSKICATCSLWRSAAQRVRVKSLDPMLKKSTSRAAAGHR